MSLPSDKEDNMNRYSLSRYESLFGGMVTTYYKDGKEIAWRNDTGLRRMKPYTEEVELSRAQGYRYWEKYFPGRSYWDIPEALAEAVDKEATYRATYWDKKQQEYIGCWG